MRTGLLKLLAGVLTLTVLLAAAPSARAESQVHIVQPGENLFRISLRYGVTVEALQAANGILGTRIYVGQSLVIPDLNAPAPAAPAAASTPGRIHIVQPRETLFTIGLQYNLSWTALQAANSLAGTKIYVGQRLTIPGAAAPAASTTPLEAPPPAQPTPPPADPPPADAPPATTSGNVHIVQRGETLFTIGLKYNVSWTALQAANNLTGTKIYTGQRLTIPSGGASAADSAAPASSAATSGTGGKRFVVDLSEQRLYAYEGDTLVRSTLISSGKWRTPTVLGTYHIYLRYTSARMRGPGYDLPNVPYVMYFYKGYGLHGTYWHNNFGTPMSHGCVNMPTAEAEWAYYWSDYGTPVTVQP